MCGYGVRWDEIMARGDAYTRGRVILEPDDEDSQEPEPINRNGIKNLDGVAVSPYLSDSGERIGNAIYLDTWFDNLNADEFYRCWIQHEEAIKGLVRYPGGYHEWLMVATLPELRHMNVPMWMIREMIVPTSECFFYIDGRRCMHGKEGSGRMHRDLFKAIVMTWYEDRAFDGKTYRQEDGTVNYVQKLQRNLTAFAMVYYPEGGPSLPGGLAEFLGAEGYQGE